MNDCLCGHPKDCHAKIGGCAAKCIAPRPGNSWHCNCVEYKTATDKVCTCPSFLADNSICQSCWGRVR